MANGNTITLGGKRVYDPPPDMPGANFFAMHTGAARHGCGQFLMTRTDYDSVAGSSPPVDLIMSSGVTSDEQTHQTVTIPVVVAGFRTASTSVDGSADMVWAVVYDRRCELTVPLYKAYNVQKDDCETFYDSTKSGGSEWTWANVVTDVGATGTWSNLPAWKPRNLVYDHVPTGRIVDDMAARCRLVVGYDYYNAGAVLPYLLAFWPGVKSARNDTIWGEGWVQKYAIHAQMAGDSARTESRKPASYDFVFPAVKTDATDPYATAGRSYVKTISASGSGPKRVVHVAEYAARRTGSSWANQSELDTVANDLFSRLEAETDIPRDTLGYGGLWPFICDGDIRGILWKSDAGGATTMIRRGDDRDFNLLQELGRLGRDQANQLIVAYAGGRVGLGSSGTRYVVGGGPAIKDALFLVSLESDGGDDGGSTPGTEPTWTYSLLDYETGDPLMEADGETEATEYEPIKPRLPSSAAAATEGIAIRQSTGDLVLVEAFENYGGEGCS